MGKIALVAIYVIAGIFYILHAYRTSVTVTKAGIEVQRIIGAPQYYAWSQITRAEQEDKQRTQYLHLYSSEREILSVNKSYSNLLVQDLKKCGLILTEK